MLLYLALILTFFPRLIEVSVISIVVQFIGSSSAFNGDIQGLFGDCLIKVSVISIVVQFIGSSSAFNGDIQGLFGYHLFC